MSLQQTILLAETRVTDIGGRYQQTLTNDVGPSGIAIVVMGILIAIAVGVGMFIFRKPRIENSPAGLLNELCRAHGIHVAGSRLLNEIASAACLQHPAMMMLSPASFDATVEIGSLQLKLDKKKQKTIGLIRRQLFGS